MTCPLCGAASPQPLPRHPDAEFSWGRCACGLVYKLEPAESGETGPSHYDDSYFDRYEKRRRRRIAKSRRQILDAMEVAPAGRLLDVGCSLGYTLEAAREVSIDADGIDVSPHAIAHCRSRGLAAGEGTLTSIPAADGTYAIAILKHVFEHTPAPREALAELRRVLVRGGAAFFAVPDVDYHRAARRFFHGEAGRAHFVYYSTATLARLLESDGFRVASVHPVMIHRRGSVVRRAVEIAAWPVRKPLRAATTALGLRKEFWMVAVRK